MCQKAFLSVYGITEGRLKTVKASLRDHGEPPRDKRGSHDNRPHAINEVECDEVKTHISSLKSRSSHYARGPAKKLYLSENLSISKLFELFKEKYPKSRVNYNKYREIFNKNFNIGFGYPRKDTCSECDRYTVLQQAEKAETEKGNDSTANNDAENRADVDCNTKSIDIGKIAQERELHLRKAERFYDIKKSARQKAAKDNEFEAVTADFQKNLPLLNISTNDVYYKRQLSFFSFNIHILGSKKSIFYTYDESIAKKRCR